jgi:radical SAM superfamily enzyme YgiQ (UPF0313 family)
MNVLLIRPVPGNERFGLGPFFRTEPLGLEYVAAALEARGHQVHLVDLRFDRPVEHHLRNVRPAAIGIACVHSLEVDDVRGIVRRIRRSAAGSRVFVGGHAAAAYPAPLLDADVDAICLGDGERTAVDFVEAVERGRPLGDIPGLLVREADGGFRATAPVEPIDLDETPLPSRRHLDASRRQFACLTYRPTWLVETARGCPFRCTFCSVWQLHDRGFRERSIDAVCRDFAATGPHVFVADDLFWHRPDRSLELARELLRRGIRKRWLLVQTRTDIVAGHPELLEAWRAVSDSFDIFFGFEAPTDSGLDALAKDASVDVTVEAAAVARERGYGVTGNFVIDPDWDEADFERLWAFVDTHRLHRSGFTILTPLPGTRFFEEVRDRIRAVDWSQFDMHHLLWEPRLGAARFFELYCETWRRSVLNLKGRRGWWRSAREVRPQHVAFLIKALIRTQRMMNPKHYLAEHRLASTDTDPARVVAACPRLPGPKGLAASAAG